jgi:hypothetical protein
MGLNTIVTDQCTLLPYVFYTGGVDVSKYVLPAQTLNNYIYNYNKSSFKGYLPHKTNQVSADLFMDTVDTGRTKGYNDPNIDAGDLFNLLSYNDTHNFWATLMDYGLWRAIWLAVHPDDQESSHTEITPIQKITSADVAGTPSAIAERLLIDEAAAYNIKQAVSANPKQTMVLFRFAHTDYFSKAITAYYPGSGGSKDGIAYMAKQTVFLDFDIIELTFNKEGVYTVIPVVSSPIDIMNDVTPPLEFKFDLGGFFTGWFPSIGGGLNLPSWLKIAFMLILVLLLILILTPIFKLIGAVFKSIGKVFKKDKGEYKKK